MITLFKSVVYLKMSCLLSPITWRIEKEGYLTLFRCRVVTSSWITQVIICCFEVLQVRWITCIWLYTLLVYIIKNTSLCVCVPQLWTWIHFNIRIVCSSWSIHIACLWCTFVKCCVIDFRQCGAGGPLPDSWLFSFETLSVSVVADSKHRSVSEQLGLHCCGAQRGQPLLLLQVLARGLWLAPPATLSSRIIYMRR